MRALVVIVVLMLAVTACMAQDMGTSMAGRAQVGGPGMSEAWLQNPAFLGLSAASNGAAGSGWTHAIAGQYEVEGMFDLTTVSWGGHPAAANWGVGAGWTEIFTMEEFGVGFGMALGNNLALGFNYQNNDTGIPVLGDMDVFDLGVAGSLPTPSLGGAQATWGVVVRDVTEEGLRTYDVGMAVEGDRWRAAFDVEDVTDEAGAGFQIGGNVNLGANGEWLVGAGLDNSDPTAGIAYDFGAVSGATSWQLGLVWHEHDAGVDDSWLLGAATQWGN